MSEENENKMEAIKKERFAVNMQTMDVAKLNTTEVYTIQRCWERLDVLLDTVYGTAKHYKEKVEEYIFLNPLITLLLVALVISVGLHFVFFTSSFSSREESCTEWFGEVYLRNAERKYLRSLNITTYDVLKNVTEILSKIDKRIGFDFKNNVEGGIFVNVFLVFIVIMMIAIVFVCFCGVHDKIEKEFTTIRTKLVTVSSTATTTSSLPLNNTNNNNS